MHDVIIVRELEEGIRNGGNNIIIDAGLNVSIGCLPYHMTKVQQRDLDRRHLARAHLCSNASETKAPDRKGCTCTVLLKMHYATTCSTASM